MLCMVTLPIYIHNDMHDAADNEYIHTCEVKNMYISFLSRYTTLLTFRETHFTFHKLNLISSSVPANEQRDRAK